MTDRTGVGPPRVLNWTAIQNDERLREQLQSVLNNVGQSGNRQTSAINNPISEQGMPNTVIDMSGGQATGLGQTSNAQNHTHSHSHTPNEASHDHSHANNQGEDQGAMGGASELSSQQLKLLWVFLQKGLPFLLLLLAKVLYNHRLGILVCIGLFGTYWHANTAIKKQIAHRARESTTKTVLTTLWLVTFISGNIFFIYYVFEDQQLYRSLYFFPPNMEELPELDMWTLLWVVGMTDFVAKFGGMIIKSLIAAMPVQCMPYKARGKYYLMVEETVQFYRCLTPITPWYLTLVNPTHGGQWFAALLIVIYTVLKSMSLWKRLLHYKKTIQKFRSDLSYGMTVKESDLTEQQCPICQDNYSQPVKLTCGHIFCEDCVCLWFDRERTCPMCRANIVDDPIWRDGATSAAIQWISY
ncbi:unnamed protein product [Owenia fusiformis]|uniref:RING-type domain-containing protein n=1 Tax=Owenia fusiformis TaxID=6347 RepID=A0A8S4Q4Z3_OWEFU|nr:unnamed protein product [Owenia fusiformis]